MNKRVLIISPFFPPVNAADMHRVRTSLPYFEAAGWDAEVIAVEPRYADMPVDELLLQSVPPGIKVHHVKAFNKKWTSKMGLGSLALRSLWYYRKKVSKLLKHRKFDLVYFSTTQFPLCVLGAYWKKRVSVPYVIDMQDPWHSDYYQNKPKHQQPAKYWFSYRLNKYLEPIAMRNVDGLISVSESYIEDLKSRYPELADVPAATITFGAFDPDIKIAEDNAASFPSLLQPGYKNIVYIGRGGADMHSAIQPVFEALKNGLATRKKLFSKLKFYFIGTSYAPNGTGKASILPLAAQYGVAHLVTEITDRISYYHALATLQHADALFIPGSDDPKYSASKLYPYLLTQKPLMAIFRAESPVVNIVQDCTSGVTLITFPPAYNNTDVYDTISHWAAGNFTPVTLKPAFNQYSAMATTIKQIELFEQATAKYKNGKQSANA